MTLAPLKLSELPTEIDALRALIIAREDIYQRFVAENNARFESLYAQIIAMRRRLFGSTSEQMPAAQGTLFTEPELLPLPKVETEQIQYERAKSNGRPKISDDLPSTIIEHDLSVEQQARVQPDSLDRIGQEQRTYINYQPAVLSKVVHVLPTFSAVTMDGEKTIITAELPDQYRPPLHRSNATASLLAHCVTSKYLDHLPLNRLEGIFARHGCRIPRQTLSDWVLGCAKLLTPVYDALKSHVLECAKIHTDDTIVPMQKEGSKQTVKARAWVYLGMDPAKPTAAVYQFTEDRKSRHCELFLKNYQGHLQADAYAGYDKLFAATTINAKGQPEAKVIEVACWAHARRKFFDIVQSQPKVQQRQGEPPLTQTVADRAIDWIRALYRREKFATDEQFTAQQRHELRNRQSRRLLTHFRLWLERQSLSILPNSPTAKAIAYALGNWQALTNYCDEPYLAIDNNGAERLLRALVTGRKNWLFVGSRQGGEAAAILYSLLHTAKANGLEPYAYLVDVLTRINSTKTSEINSLLPFAATAEIE
jgi:transposase